jgi:membrane protease YdiL (CAAX protease family)
MLKTKLLAALKVIAVFVGYYLVLGLLTNPLFSLLQPMMSELMLGLLFSLTTVLLTIGYHFLILKVFSLKRPLPQSGIPLKGGWLKRFGMGSAFAGVFIALLWGIVVLMGGFSVSVNPLNSGTYAAVAVMIVRMLCTGIQEEIITRGTLAFAGRSGGRLFTAILVSVIFGVLHGLGGFTGPETIFVNITLVVFSLIVFALTWMTGDLWIAIGFHFAWNAVMGLLGSPISGGNFTGILTSTATGATFLNGSVYGLEGSVFTALASALLLAFLLVMRQKGKFAKNAGKTTWLADK